jgi:DNA-binding winged helix-turn-helix (wHTH) protein
MISSWRKMHISYLDALVEMDSIPPEFPYLEVKSPDDELFVHELKGKESVTIGRSEQNDLALPDPQKYISRQHCRLECQVSYWWVVDDDSNASGEPSTCGTFLRRAGGGQEIDVRQEGRLRLQDGDTILILAKLLPPNDTPYFWKLTIREAKTHLVQGYGFSTQLTYSLSQRRLLSIQDGTQQEISLDPLERRFLHYMAEQNQANQGNAVLCTYDELIRAGWVDEPFHTSNEVNVYICRLRKKIEQDRANPKYIKTVKSFGYRLENLKIIS